jgi:hypothetical protein
MFGDLELDIRFRVTSASADYNSLGSQTALSRYWTAT